MLFNSYEFIFIFLPLTFLFYYSFNKYLSQNYAKGFLALSSLFFYSWWNIMYLPLLLVSIIFNFIIGSRFTYEKNQIKYY